MIFPIAPADRRRVQRVLPFAALIVAVAAFDLACHEFWRDEAGAMLLANDVPWGSLLRAMRYEGVPPLFHAMLKVAGLVLPNPMALVAVGALDSALLLYGTYSLLEAISEAPRASARLTFAFALTYTFAYELGAMVRQYTLGLGLALLTFAHLRKALRATAPRHHVWIASASAGFAALASAHAACVAGGGLLAFGLLSAVSERPLRNYWPVVFTLPCFALDAWLASPFPGRVWAGNRVLHLEGGTAVMLSLQALVEGLMPSDWWLVESLVPPRLADAFAVVRHLAFGSLFMALGFALLARLRLLRERWRVEAFDLLAVLASWPPLLEIIVRHYWGFYRHHLMLGIPLIVIVAGWGIATRTESLLAEEARDAGLALLAPWFVLEVGLALGSFALDAVQPFSDGKAAARVMPEGAHVVAESEWKTLSLLFWRPDITIRSSAWHGRPYRYIRPDTEWRMLVYMPALVVDECRVAPDKVTYAGGVEGLGELAECARQIEYPRMNLGEHPLTWESFEMHRIDCACVLSAE
jgi:hypothetical protein